MRKHRLLSPRRAVGRLVLSLAAGVIALLLVPSETAWTVRAMVSWDATATALLVQSWAILARSDGARTEQRASDEDPGGAVVFAIAILSSLFSLLAATLVLREVRGHTAGNLWLALSLLSVALSWCVTHTEYTFRYAHLYYRGAVNGGLVFPATERPDDLDFAYYAFTIGMCFQVSDVQITARELRRATLIHALISFVFNTMIVALALNVVSQLLDG